VRRWVQRRLLSVLWWVKAGATSENFLQAPTILAWDLSGDKADSSSFRLLRPRETGDYLSMDHYTRETRIELTPLGWLYIAEESLREPLKSSSKQQTELRRGAALAIASAMRALETGQRVAASRNQGLSTVKRSMNTNR
jgi:hypothetical protein